MTQSDPLIAALRKLANETFCKYDASIVLELTDEAAALSTPPPSLDAIAHEFIRVRGAHNPTADELEGDQEVKPCAWCRLAAEQAVEALFPDRSIP